MIALALVAAYLLGSVSFAVLVSRAMRLADPRSYGSGNPGATNVLRSGNRAAALLTLVGDGAKGALAVWLGLHAGQGNGTVAIGCGAAAFLGHVFPVFLRFRGGKGVATFLGVLLAIDPWLGAACCLLWLAVALVSRFSSLASMVVALAAPVLLALWRAAPAAGVGCLVAMSALLLWRHRTNISNLLAGRESRIGGSARASSGPT
jgi:glycerol-3-phosphate acyltransferase PlsY